MVLRVCIVEIDVVKGLCGSNTWFAKKSREKRCTVWVKIKPRLILYWLVKTTKYLENVKAVPSELQHWLMVIGIDKKLKKVVKNKLTV